MPMLEAPSPAEPPMLPDSLTPHRSGIVKQFHLLYYRHALQTWRNTFWRGIQVWKCPLDLWVYQEIVFEVRPDLIIETGTGHGGSAHFLATLCDVSGRGDVITVDLHGTPFGSQAPTQRPEHPRITYLVGSSTSASVVHAIQARIQPHHRVLVILDSDHTRDHVLDELLIYGRMVTPGSYLIVEDTNVNAHPVLPRFGPGPMEAIEDFLKKDASFHSDETREKFFMTFNPRGFLRKAP